MMQWGHNQSSNLKIYKLKISFIYISLLQIELSRYMRNKPKNIPYILGLVVVEKQNCFEGFVYLSNSWSVSGTLSNTECNMAVK